MSKKSPFDSPPRGIVLLAVPGDNDTPNMEDKQESLKPSIHGASKAGKRERAFELSLPALVTGLDVMENRFREKTLISSISAEEATIWLRSQVTIGAKLDIALDIPKTLILENSLKLQLSGTVKLTQTDSTRTGKKLLVSLQLDKRFKLLPIPLNIN
ncbi:MAG: hypothetical protein WBC70_10230 [Candidatus Aminicenantales bacterium]